MQIHEKAEICSCACREGWDYCFCAYSAFQEIKDDEFHRLREAYVAASKALKAYIDYDKYDEDSGFTR